MTNYLFRNSSQAVFLEHRYGYLYEGGDTPMSEHIVLNEINTVKQELENRTIELEREILEATLTIDDITGKRLRNHDDRLDRLEALLLKLDSMLSHKQMSYMHH